MNKSDLVAYVASELGMPKADVKAVVESTLKCLAQKMASNERVQLLGFGSFESRDREPRKGLNPKTGEVINIPAKRVPIFKPSKQLSEKVNV